MGNCLRVCAEDDSDSDHYPSYQGHYGSYEPAGNAPPLPIVTIFHGYSAFSRDLQEFKTTKKLPSGLGNYVSEPKSHQTLWFQQLLRAWESTIPSPETGGQVRDLITRTLQGHIHNYELKELLRFYNLHNLPPESRKPQVPKVPQAPKKPAVLPAPQVPNKPNKKLETPPPPSKPQPQVPNKQWKKQEAPPPPSKPQRPRSRKANATVQYVIVTMPIQKKEVGDGDGFTAFVEVDNDSRERSQVPEEITVNMSRRRAALARQDMATVNEIERSMKKLNYKVIYDDKLVRECRVRLKGVDAPELKQPFGEQAKHILAEIVQGRKLILQVYYFDQYGREVGDAHVCGTNIFVQEELLKKGAAHHYTFYDDRPNFAKLEAAAKAAGVGLWANVNCEMPWDHKKKEKQRHKKMGGG